MTRLDPPGPLAARRLVPAPPVSPALALVLVIGGLGALTGCATDVADLEPEIPRNAAGEPLAVTVEVRYYTSQGEKPFVLSNRANRRALALQHAGRLPAYHKVATDEDVGRLVAFMRSRGFFEHARPAGNPPAAVPARTRRVVTYTAGTGPPLRMIQAYGMALSGQQDQVQAVVEISQVFHQVWNQTLSLTADPKRRRASDFLNQPALRRRSR